MVRGKKLLSESATSLFEDEKEVNQYLEFKKFFMAEVMRVFLGYYVTRSDMIPLTAFLDSMSRDVDKISETFARMLYDRCKPNAKSETEDTDIGEEAE